MTIRQKRKLPFESEVLTGNSVNKFKINFFLKKLALPDFRGGGKRVEEEE